VTEADSPSVPHKKGRQLTSLIAVVVALAIVGGGVVLSQSQELTIIVVSLDTTRPDHLSAYGYDRSTSPTLERLAREGVQFTNARSTTSWTLPAHMSLFTGLPAKVHDVNVDFQTLDAGRPVMGEVFAKAGFYTEGYYTAPYVHQRYGFGRGMEFYEPMTANPMAFDLPPAEMREQLGLREMFSHQEVTSVRVAQQALRFVRDASGPRNLLFLHLFDPHYDYRAGPNFRAPFVDPSYEGEITGDGLMGQLDLIAEGNPADLQQLKDLYDAELLFTDAYLGHVIKSVEESDKLGSTIIVVVSDHGEEFFEHGRYGHRMGLHEEVIRVPFIVWGPGIIPEGLVIDDDVAIYDVLPTLMDYAGIEESPFIYGRSLRPLIDGKSLPPRASASSLTFLHADARDYYTLHESTVYEGLKYIRKVQVPWSPLDQRNLSNPPNWSTATIEVYDLREDPAEQSNLYVVDPGDPRVERAAQAFQDETDRLREATARFTPEGSIDMAPDMGVLDIMKQLGYLQMAEEGDRAVTTLPPTDTQQDPPR
jgi:arylsulfatase A-like enzyme